jgi:hypothetical protein
MFHRCEITFLLKVMSKKMKINAKVIVNLYYHHSKNSIITKCITKCENSFNL